MAHPDYKPVSLSLGSDPSWDEIKEFSQAFEVVSKMVDLDITRLMADKQVTHRTASKIVYLRGRSRWTQEKEDELVRLDLAGEPVPFVYDGEF